MKQTIKHKQGIWVRLLLVLLLFVQTLTPVMVALSEEAHLSSEVIWDMPSNELTVNESFDLSFRFNTDEQEPQVILPTNSHLDLDLEQLKKDGSVKELVPDDETIRLTLTHQASQTYKVKLRYTAKEAGTTYVEVKIAGQDSKSEEIAIGEQTTVASETETTATDASEEDQPTLESESTLEPATTETKSKAMRAAVATTQDPYNPLKHGWEKVDDKPAEYNKYSKIKINKDTEMAYGIGAVSRFGTKDEHPENTSIGFYKSSPNIALVKDGGLLDPVYVEEYGASSNNKMTFPYLILTPSSTGKKPDVKPYRNLQNDYTDVTMKKYRKSIAENLDAYLLTMNLKTMSNEKLFMVTTVEPVPTRKSIKVTQTLYNDSGKELPQIAFGSTYDLQTSANGFSGSMYYLEQGKGFAIKSKGKMLTYTIPKEQQMAWRLGHSGDNGSYFYDDPKNPAQDPIRFLSLADPGDATRSDVASSSTPNFRSLSGISGTKGFKLKSPVAYNLAPGDSVSMHYYIGAQYEQPRITLNNDQVTRVTGENYVLNGNGTFGANDGKIHLQYALLGPDEETDNIADNQWKDVKTGNNLEIFHLGTTYTDPKPWTFNIPKSEVGEKNKQVVVRAVATDDPLNTSPITNSTLLLVEKEITPVIKAYKGNQKITQDVAAVAGSTVTYKIEIPEQGVIYKELNFEAALDYNGNKTLEPKDMKLGQGENFVENAEINWDSENKKITVNAKDVTANTRLYLVYKVELPKDDSPVDTGELELKTTATITKGTTADFDLKEATSKHTLSIQIGELKWHTVPSNISFKTGKVSGKRQTLEVDKIAEENDEPIGLEVSDTRIETNGWQINAKLQKELNFGMDQQKNVLKFSQGGKTTPIPFNTEFTSIWSHEHSSAEEGIYKVPLKRTVDSPDKGRGMFLDVPGGVMKMGTYEGVIEWQLQDGPGATIGDGGDSE